jgi:hypothetical protein
MSQRITKVKKRRWVTYLWIVGMIVLVSVLIYFEQTPLLYILSTLGVTILLVIVALADLGSSELSSVDGGAQTAPVSSAPQRK